MSYGHVVGRAFRDAKNLPAVGRGKSAVAAFVVGVLFGPIGLGIYLKSWADFLIPITLVIGGSVMTAGVGAPFFWVLTGAWGAWRVVIANQSVCGPSPKGWIDDPEDEQDDDEEPPARPALPRYSAGRAPRRRVSNASRN